MVATRDIEPGEIVLLDRAVVVAPDDRPGNNLIGVSSIIQRALYAFNVRLLLRSPVLCSLPRLPREVVRGEHVALPSMSVPPLRERVLSP